MHKSIRLLLVALSAALALTATGSALAAYNPKLVVNPASMAVGGGGPVTFQVSVPRDDDATAKVTIYVPQGFGGILDQATGKNLGPVSAQVFAKALGGALLPLTGNVVVDDPAKHPNDPCAPGLHDAVWNLVLTAAGQTLTVPVYWDTIESGPEVAFAKFKAQICLPSPDVPQASGGATFGAKLIFAQFTVSGVFNNPVARGENTFRSVWTPYVAGTATPNAAGTVEARSSVRMPAELGMSAVLNQKTGIVTIRGTLSEAGVTLAGQAVKLKIGTTAKGVKVFKTVRTNAKGNYAATIRIAKGKTRYLRASVAVAVRDFSGGCGTPALAPGGCVNHTLSGYTLENRRVLKLTRRR
jgi:hypothetical protein